MDDRKPLIIAHRGAHFLAPENTIAACHLALENGANALEVDVRLCGSGEIVLFHDNFLWHHFHRLQPVIAADWYELKQMRFPPKNFIQNDRICTLDEFLQEFKGTVPLNLDVKTFMTDYSKLAKALVETVKKYDVMEQVWFSAFNPLFLFYLKKKYPEARIGYLFRNLSRMHRTFDLAIQAEAWHPHHHLVDQRFLELARKHGKELYVWTITEPERYKELVQLPFEGLITDILLK